MGGKGDERRAGWVSRGEGEKGGRQRRARKRGGIRARRRSGSGARREGATLVRVHEKEEGEVGKDEGEGQEGEGAGQNGEGEVGEDVSSRRRSTS